MLHVAGDSPGVGYRAEPARRSARAPIRRGDPTAEPACWPAEHPLHIRKATR
jgi:hypothetical protein